MKYKHIPSAIHNLGQSFCSTMNYLDNGYVIDDLERIHRAGYDIRIDWLHCRFDPADIVTPRIQRSVGRTGDRLRAQFATQNVDLEKITVLSFHWPADGSMEMRATDDRGQEFRQTILMEESREQGGKPGDPAAKRWKFWRKFW